MLNYLLLTIGTLSVFFFAYKLFEKAGHKRWFAFIPILNLIYVLRITGKPLWWLILFIIPGVNALMLVITIVALLKSFGMYDGWNLTIATILSPVFFYQLGVNKKKTYVGPSGSEEYRKSRKKSKTREWVDALLFAAIAATIIRWFFIEAYTIPTSSMEKTLLVGDFLFVSKINYGSRVPMTPIAFPFAHHTMPVIKGKSYVKWFSLPYFRFPGLEKIKNNDVVVFNFPGNDQFNNEKRPVDKRENYIKRCIGIPGDTVQIIDRITYVNGKRQDIPESAKGQFAYLIKTYGNQELNWKGLKREFDINAEKKYNRNNMHERDVIEVDNGYYIIYIPEKKLEAFKKYPGVEAVFALKSPQKVDFSDTTVPEIIHRIYTNYWGMYDEVYPRTSPEDTLLFRWTRDNYGPIYLPKKGDKIELNPYTYKIYYRCITLYEGNTLEMKDGKYELNGAPATDYTFSLSYYWMMGDNRHNSLDSRYWGFVPENHIVGKALFIWMSWDKHADNLIEKVRWNRLFRGIR